MKTKLTLLALLVSIVTIAQNGINYKAVIKDDLGNVIANDLIQVQFSILQGAAQTNVYTETHTPTTDTNGIIIVNIGEGTTSDAFTDIDWASDNHFLNVQIDTGSGFVDIGTTQFMHMPYAIQAIKAANVNGLEAIDEGNGIGWRLVGRNPANHGDIGLNAIDFTFSPSEISATGATGDYALAMGAGAIASGNYSTATGFITEASENAAVAMGNGTTASGESSTALGSVTTASAFASTAMGEGTLATGIMSIAMGFNSEASGDFSTAIGRGTLASGTSSFAAGRNSIASQSYSTAIGFGSIASGSNSTAIGPQSEASGINSIAMGQNSEASGLSSFSFGSSTIAQSFSQMTVGRYNIPFGNSEFWVSTDPLFTIGNGTFDSRSNALTVLKNGNVGLGTSTPDETLHINGVLKIGTETIEDGGNNNLRFNASLFPDNDNVMRLGNSDLRWTNVWATDGTINTSDRRAKTNITNLNYGLNDILMLNPVSFNWKSNPNDDTKLGLIAQDVLKVIPEVVKTHDWETDEDGNKMKKELERMGVYYSDLVPVLIKAIQEQQTIIETLNAKNSNQESKLNSIQQNYQSLLSRIEIIESNTSN